MCGINGILRLRRDSAPVDREELLRSRDRMASRGPDGFGEWMDETGTIGLGHRRLAIIDLSETGRQPMQWADGRFRLIFNGEIYNYRQLRNELEAQGVVFHTQSDTEVVLALYEREGEKMLSRLRGMFALAIWDSREEALFLARDPYGIKPLYYTVESDQLRFASQVKALLAGGAVADDVDEVALCGFLLWGSVPEPLTLRKRIRALPSGSWLRVRPGEVPTPRSYYEFGQAIEEQPSDPVEALADSVRAHLVADVPVALFLSAGLDSSLIAALAQRELETPLTTLTLRFDDFAGSGMDEAPLAAEVARTIGTRHVERHVKKSEFLDLWPRALDAMDQPSIDGFNTFVVSHAAHSEGIKVVMSGLGGDELFGSYDSFADVPRWARWSRSLALFPGATLAWGALARNLRPGQPKLRGMLRHGGSLAGSYFLRRGLFLPEEVESLLGVDATAECLESYAPWHDAAKYLAGAQGDGWRSVHLMESTQYMRNQLLRDSDWASMASSLELRVPLVDAKLRRSIARNAYEPARSQGKAAIVRAAAPELPAALWTRPKSGFSIPVMEWLDEAVGIETARGQTSRMLALRVLEQFGIQLGPKRQAIGA